MSNPQRLRVLWLCGWYPSKSAPFDSLFIQRHASAVSLLNDVYVIHVVKSKDTIKKSCSEIVIKNDGRLIEEVVYYPSPKGFFRRIFSQVLMTYHYLTSVIRYVKKYDKPKIFHFHIGYQVGLTAWFLRRICKNPQLLSEHWTGYLPQASFKLTDIDILRRFFLSRLLATMTGIHAVSNELLRNIHGLSPAVKSVVIPNLVDETVFFTSERTTRSVFVFIHVSNMSIQKRPDELLMAVKCLLGKGLKFKLVMIGDFLGKVGSIVKSMNLSDFVTTIGDIDQREVATYLRTSDAMVHSAHYETFGCVLIEAFASGIPVVAYDLPVFKELIVPGKNGVVAKQMTPESLADAMEQMMNTIKQYDSDQIRADAVAKYSMPVVAAQFDAWYKSCLAINPRTSIE